jgi:hypothetical protein
MRNYTSSCATDASDAPLLFYIRLSPQLNFHTANPETLFASFSRRSIRCFP